MGRQEDWLWWRKKIDDVTYAKDRNHQNALMDVLAAHAEKRCDELDRLRAENEALRDSAKELGDAASAYQELCGCYRVGRKPSEKLFSRIDKAKAALARLKTGGE